MRNLITGWSNGTESLAGTVANAASELIAYQIQPKAELGSSIEVHISMKLTRFAHGKKPGLFISKMILRKWTIEGLFAEAKQFHGLRRTRYRGLKKVSIQALMTAMAQNIKRIIKQLLDIHWLLRRYLYPRKEILSAQNYLNYFRRMPRLYLCKSALA